MKQSRNDRCACGSERKYKHCCIYAKYRSQALIFIDTSKDRKKELSNCKKDFKKLDKLQTELSKNSADEKQSFDAWINSEFQSDRLKIIELTKSTDDLRALIHEVFLESKYEKISQAEAYKRVSKRRELKMPPRDFSEFKESEFQEEHEECDKEPNLDEVIRETFENMFGSKSRWRGDPRIYEQIFENFRQSAKKEFGDESEDGLSNSLGKEKLSNKDQIKTIYRSLARSLHPDMNPNLTLRKQELWIEVQKAYQERDLESLEIYALHADLLDDKDSQFSSLSLLQELRLKMKNKIRQIQSQIRAAKKQAYWNFSERKKDKSFISTLKKDISYQFRMDKLNLEDQILHFKSQINFWERKKTKRTPARPLFEDFA